jgi:hypothetical protein
MSDEWIWQGFYGPRDLVIAAKLATEQMPASIVGVIIPPIGAGVVDVDASGADAMYAVQTRSNAPLPTPEGLRVARTEIVGRLVGA